MNFAYWIAACLLACFPLSATCVNHVDSWKNLEETLDPCVISTKQVHIPGSPDAFNPSLLAWEDGWLLSFRDKQRVNGIWHSHIGLVKLTPSFEVMGPISFLDTGSHLSADPRLIEVEGTIYIVYSDVSLAALLAPVPGEKHILEMVVGKIEEHNGVFSIHSLSHLTEYPNRVDNRVEKNWVPFSYANQLLLAYSLEPHTIFMRPYDNAICQIFAKSTRPLKWPWGIVRGGTPAICVEGKYLSFFHSSKAMKSLHSEGKASRHYFLGAYLFDTEPPFTIEKISPKPIVGPNFYIGKNYPSYWTAIQAVFPCGLVQKGPHLWVSYGRQDHECWVAQIDTQILLNSLIDVQKSIK